jgi:replicative DNA helicase
MSWTDLRIARFANVTADKPKDHPTIGTVLAEIRQPAQAVERLVERIRAAASKAERNQLKARLPAVVFAADMHTRAKPVPLDDKIASLTGYCCLDLDDLGTPADAVEAKRRLTADPHIAAAFLSPSGAGVKALVRLPDPQDFRSGWSAASAYLQRVHHLRADPARKDLVGLCFLSHDPDIHIASGEVPPIPEEDLVVNAPIATDRHRHLLHTAVQLRDRGADRAAIRTGVDAEAERCTRDVSASERRGIVDWVMSQVEVRSAPDPWPEMRPLTTTREPPSLDLDTAIPDELPDLRNLIRGTSQALQMPVEMVAPLAVSLASLGAARVLEVEPMPGWREPAPVWVSIVAEPSERKTALLAAMAAPVYAWQKAQRDHLGPALARYQEERHQAEARLSGLRATLAKPSRGGPPADPERMTDQAMQLAEGLAAMPDLRAPDLITADATPEAARDLLVRNGEKLGAIAAEGDVVDVLLGRYGDGKANLGLFLSGHAGDYCPAHRVGRDQPLEHPAIVCALMVQPHVVEQVLADPAAVGRGLVARFSFIAPRTWVGRRELQPPACDPFAVQWWLDALVRLLDLPWPGKVVIGPDGPMRCGVATRILPLDPGAFACHLALRAAIEPRLAPDTGDLRHLRAYAGKLPGAIARIALAFQALADPQAEAVSESCMRAACAWSEFLLGHTQAVVGEAGDPDGALARKILHWVQKKGEPTFTAGECYRDHRTQQVARPEDIVPAIDLLVAHGLIRRLPEAPSQRGGRPALRYEVRSGRLASGDQA